MNVSHLSPAQRIDKVLERAWWESKRKNHGPLFCLLARMHELDNEVEAYASTGLTQTQTLTYGRGSRAALSFAISVVMKYRHRVPGLTADEIDAVLKDLGKTRIFTSFKKEHLPVPV